MTKKLPYSELMWPWSASDLDSLCQANECLSTVFSTIEPPPPPYFYQVWTGPLFSVYAGFDPKIYFAIVHCGQ